MTDTATEILSSYQADRNLVRKHVPADMHRHISTVAETYLAAAYREIDKLRRMAGRCT